LVMSNTSFRSANISGTFIVIIDRN
jgi:hypothetical protein